MVQLLVFRTPCTPHLFATFSGQPPSYVLFHLFRFKTYNTDKSMKTLHCTAMQAAGLFFALALQTSNLMAQNTDSPLGKTDFAAFYTEAPLPPANTGDAARRNFGADWRNPIPNALDNFYQPFTDKVESAINVYKQYYAQKMEAYYGQQNEASMHAQAAAQANQSPIIASMGGVDKVAQMSPEEARAAALQAVESYKADPFAANGVQSAGMTALYQKIISDPAYAARFEKMSEKEKEAELRKYMANDKPQIQTPAQVAAHQQKVEQQNQQANKVRLAMEFQQQIVVFTTKIGEIQAQYIQQRSERLAAPGNHADIQADFGKKYALIPEVELGEYGRDKDPEQVAKIQLEAAAKHHAFAATVLKQDIVALNKLKADLNSFAAEYLQYLAAHKQEINGNVADQMQGTETESLFIGLEGGLLDLALELVKHSKESVKEAAQWEKHLLETKSGYSK